MEPEAAGGLAGGRHRAGVPQATGSTQQFGVGGICAMGPHSVSLKEGGGGRAQRLGCPIRHQAMHMAIVFQQKAGLARTSSLE